LTRARSYPELKSGRQKKIKDFPQIFLNSYLFEREKFFINYDSPAFLMGKTKEL